MRKRRGGGNSLIAIHRNSDSTHPKASLAWTEQAELLREAEHTVFVEWAGISYCARQTKIPWSFYFIVFSGCTAKSPGKMPSPTATGFHCLFLLVSACCQIPQGSNFYPFSYVVSILPQPHCFSLGHCLQHPDVFLCTHKTLGEVRIRLEGNLNPECVKEVEKSGTGLFTFPSLKASPEGTQQNTSCFSVCKGFQLLSLETSLHNIYVGTARGWNSSIL